jgi:hypothetical protein
LLKAQSLSDPVVYGSKNMKRNGFQPSIRPKSKKKPSPLNSQTHICQDDIRKFKIIQKEREKASLGVELEALKGDISKIKKSYS